MSFINKVKTVIKDTVMKIIKDKSTKDTAIIYKEKMDNYIDKPISERGYIFTSQDYQQNKDEKDVFIFKYQIPNLLMDNKISIFKTLDNKYYLLSNYYWETSGKKNKYFKNINCIQVYDIKNEQVVTFIKKIFTNANDSITTMKYFTNGKREYLIIVTFYSRLIIYNIKTFKEILRMKKISVRASDACIVFDKKNNPIVYIIGDIGKVYKIKKYDLKGKYLGELNTEYNNYICDFQLFYDEIKREHYLIYVGSGKNGHKIVSHIAKTEHLYNIFDMRNSNDNYCINKIKEEILLFTESMINIYHHIFVYDFHRRDLKYDIKCNFDTSQINKLFCFSDNILVYIRDFSPKYKRFYFIDWKKDKYLGNIYNGEKKIISFNKMNHPRFGECLVVHSINDIKLFQLKNGISS